MKRLTNIIKKIDCFRSTKYKYSKNREIYEFLKFIPKIPDEILL